MALIDTGTIPTAASGSTTQNVLPDWYTNYAKDILAKQQAISANPYQTYEPPRIAGMTQDTLAGYDQARQAAQGFNANLDRAASMIGSATANSGYDAASGYLQRAANINPLDTASNNIYRGVSLAQQALQAPGAAAAANPFLQQAGSLNPVAAASPYLDQAGSLNGIAAASPYLNQAGSLISSSAQNGAMAAASPYLTNASQSSVAGINAYLNPYQDAVINRIGDLGARTLREKLLPEIGDRFIGTGQFGGSRQAEAIGRAVRDTMEGISAEQAKALQAGYSEAAGLSAADLARQAQLGSLAGSLSAQDQQAKLSAGTQLSNLGQTAGTLTNQQMNTLANLGQTAGSLANQQMSTLANLGQTAGSLANQDRQAQLDVAQQVGASGTQLGNLAAQQMSNLTNIGQSLGSIRNADANSQLSAAAQLAGLAGQQQQLGLTGAGALQQIGQQQQALNQQNLDLARQDFLAQQNDPQNKLNALIAALNGTKAATPSAQLSEGYAPYNDPNAVPKTSGLQNAATAAGTLLQIKQLLGF